MKPGNIHRTLARITDKGDSVHLHSVDIKIPKNKINPYSSSITNSFHPKRKLLPKKNQQFTIFKQQYRLPNFVEPNRRKRTLDIKDRTKTIQSKPRQLKIKTNLRSKSIATTNIKDSIYESLVRKQLRSIDLSELHQSSIIVNKLDHKFLTQYQKQEIKSYQHVYYIGHKAYPRKFNGNYRDSKNNYRALIGDHIGYRFQILKIIGEGAFGKVLEVFDHKNSKVYALKITKHSEDLHHQFQLQVSILKIARQCQSDNKSIVEIKGDFEFRGHLCIVTEMLSMNLYHFIKAQNFQGMNTQLVRKIIIQVLQSLLFLHRVLKQQCQRQITHCDIKPENVCFKQLGKSGVKLIDFGSACYLFAKEFTYIQSRYYRAPQIVLVKPYDHKIDIWSLGCMVFQLSTGNPLFPARNQQQQMQMLLHTLGAPPQYFLQKCERSSDFKCQSPQKLTSIRDKMNGLDEDMISFVQDLVKWSPQQRLQAEQALVHKFILNGLPDAVRQEHIKQMKSSNPYGLY